MRKALLIYLYGKGEPGLSLALGFLKAYADHDEQVHRSWTLEIVHRAVETDPREVIETVSSAGAGLVAFSCYSWNIRAVQRVVAGLDPNAKPLVVLGGVEVTPRAQEVLRQNRQVDFVVFGEGEQTFCELLRTLGEGLDRPAERLGEVAGLAWRDGLSIRVNAPRPPIADLSTIPSPYLSNSYGDYVRGIETVPLETARGCPFSCTFCFEPRGFKIMRAFPLERVREEVACLVRMGIPEIEFFDTNINYDRKRAVEIFQFLRTQGKRVRYRFELRAELIDEKQTRELGALSFFAEIGLQSTNPRALEAVKRTLDRARFERGVRSLLEASIYRPCSYSPLSGVLIDVMVGLPHDTATDIRRSFDYAFGLVPSRIAVAITKVLPGTELHDEANRYRYKINPDEDHVLRSNATLSAREVREFVHFKYAVESAYNKLHAVRTIGWMAGKLAIQPSEIFMAFGRELAKNGRSWETYTVKDLTEVMANICRQHGNDAAAEKVGSRLAVETTLNLLQNLKEKRRSILTHVLFAVGYRFLKLVGGLPPLPEAAPDPAIPENRESRR